MSDQEAGRSLAALVRSAARQRPDAPAVVTREERLTWAELDAAVDRAAAGYAARDLAPGDRVAVQLPNGLPWLRAVLGALRAGLVVVPVNTAYTEPELEYVLTDSGAALLVAPAERDEIAGVPVCPGAPEADGPPPAVADDPAELAFLCYTSGTTGRPRGAMLTSGALRANQEQCLAMEPPPVRPDDRVLLVLPLFHVYGLNAGFGLVAATGACAVLEETFDPRATLAVMAEEHVSAVPGAPPMYQAWLAVADAAGSDADLRRAFAAVRVASSGAAPAARGGLDGDARPGGGHGVGGLRADRGLARRGQHRRHRPAQAQLHRRAAAGHRGGPARHRRHRRSRPTSPTPSRRATTSRRRAPRRTAPTTCPARVPASCGSAGPTSSPATGPTAPTGPTPTAGWVPVTSPTGTSTATCTSSTAAAT